MSLCHVLAVAALWAVGQADIELKQPQVSITSQVGTTARVICQVSGIWNFAGWYIHWYQQKPNQPLEHLLYVQSTSKPQKISLDNVRNKFVAGKNGDKSTSDLTINSITPEDEGTYYCACWKPVKLFGSGTKLIVTESVIPKKPPKSIIFLPTLEEVKQKKSGTYICLLEDFFPNVIKSYWKENKYSQPLDAQFGPVTGNGSSYSQVSWLTVQEDSLSKNLTYFYQHENTGIEPQEIPIASVWEGFKNSSSEACKDKDWTKGLQELHFANISAFYTYTILLVKSTIYFTIVLFFLYQKKVVKMLGSQRSK